MKNLLVFVLVGAVLGCGCNVLASELAWEEISGGNTDATAVLVDADNPKFIYLASGNTILKTQDGGDSWRPVLVIKGGRKGLNLLGFDPVERRLIYAATGCGLYRSNDRGKSWQKIFKSSNYLENECTSLGIFPDALYLGTKGGLFVSKDKGRTWHRQAGEVGKCGILAIAAHQKEPGKVYVVCSDKVFRTQDYGASWDKIFTGHANIGAENGQQEPAEENEESISFSLRDICLDPNHPDYLYLATSSGIYQSQNQGQTWQALSDYGLLSKDARRILVSAESQIYALADSGVFTYRNCRWQELSLGLMAEKMHFLAADTQDNLYAACDKGLFKAKAESASNIRDNSRMDLYYEGEPDIQEVQIAAIEYAEVSPEKIKDWRRRAAGKALLPEVSVGINRDTSELWHWEGGSTTKSEDDTLVRGSDAIEWDVSLKWDLSELIWNDDQTSIDVRSRLMVELRDDTLDEVTKIYFERIRVKMDLDNLSLEERNKRQEKELRLRELTAYLDALTGGYFSQRTKY